MTDRKLAQQVLKIREKGPNPWLQFAPISRGIVFRYLYALFVLALIVFKVFPSHLANLLYLALGMVIGVWLRDFKTVRLQARLWPFSVKVTDWDVVEEIARCENCERRKTEQEKTKAGNLEEKEG